MPLGYVEMDAEEMEYLEGGGIPRWIASGILDFAGLAICPYLAPVKWLGRQAAARLVSKFLPKLVGAAAYLARTVLGMSINATTGKIGSMIYGDVWAFTSVGGIIALALDIADGNKNGWIG